jgi:hypothetical protein
MCKEFYDALQEHIDIMFGEETEFEIENFLTMLDNEDNEHYSMSYPTFRSVIPHAYEFLRRNVNKELLILNLLGGIFGFREQFWKDAHKSEIVGYYLNNNFQINIRSGNIDINKTNLIIVCYLSFVLSQEVDINDCPILDPANDYKLEEEGDLTFTITPEIARDIQMIKEYGDKHFTERKKQKEVKTHIVSDIVSIDMKIRQKYFDLIYNEMFGHIDTKHLSNPYSHRNTMKKKFLLDDPFENEGKKIDYTLHAFCVYFNTRVNQIIWS